MSRVIKFRYVAKHTHEGSVRIFTHILDLHSIEDTTDVIELICSEIDPCTCCFNESQNHCDCDSILDHGEFEIISRDEFTGLTDKNGVEIFEGDLYKTTVLAGHPTDRWGGEYWVKVTAKVEFVNGRFVGVVVGHAKSSYEPEYKKGHFDGRIAEIKDMEVIGIIHQNPELIGE